MARLVGTVSKRPLVLKNIRLNKDLLKHGKLKVDNTNFNL